MRAIVKGFVIAVYAAAVLALVTATPSEGARRPTIDNIDACTNKTTDKGCEGAICYCCYTDGPDKGCWICNSDFRDCVWDPASLKGLKGRGVIRPGSGGVLQSPPKVPPSTTVPPSKVTPQVAPGQTQR